MKILVTGSTGKVGSLVSEALVDAGHEVLATDVRAAVEPGPAGPTRVADLCQIDAVRELVQGVDVVCHIGNLPVLHASGRAAGFMNNTVANYNVFLAATEAGVRRMVYASSVQAYGCLGYTSGKGPGGFTVPQYLPLDEDHPLCPADAYPLSKANGEFIAQSFCRALPDLTAWSLRYTGVRLPRPPADGPPRPRVPDPKHMVLGGLCTWVHAEDAVRATVLACGADRPGHTAVNVVAESSAPAWSEDALVAAYGVVPPFRRTVSTEQSLICGDRAEQLLGFRARHR